MSIDRPAPRPSVATHLPLTSLMFLLLSTLAESPGHGYVLVQRIRERSGGVVDPGTGSFYSIIKMAVDNGLVEERPGPPNDRRRQFGISAFGCDVLKAETRRLSDLVRTTKHTLSRLDAKGVR